MRRIAGKLTTAGLTLVPLRIHLRNGWILEGSTSRGSPKEEL